MDAPPLDPLPRATGRRAFLGHLAASTAATGLAASGLAAALPSASRASVPAARGAVDTDDKWLRQLTGKHRQIFDMPQPAGGLPMLHVRNFLNGYRDAYGLKHPDVSAAVGLYFMTVPFAFGDAMWSKYQLGAASKVNDRETRAPAVRNPVSKVRDGATTLPIADGPVPLPADTSIADLQKRGTVFLLCNNALNFWAGSIATATNQGADVVRKELLEHVLPGIVVVPAMVIAYNKAQEAGVTYMFLP